MNALLKEEMGEVNCDGKIIKGINVEKQPDAVVIKVVV